MESRIGISVMKMLLVYAPFPFGVCRSNAGEERKVFELTVRQRFLPVVLNAKGFGA